MTTGGVWIFTLCLLAWQPVRSVLPPKSQYLDGEEAQCTKVKFPPCSKDYSQTLMSRRLGIATQDEAINRYQTYAKLIESNCSQFTSFFLCSVYFPVCTAARHKPEALDPCKQFCLHVKGRCEHLLEMQGLSWPRDLDCSALPDYDPNQESLCIQARNYSTVEAVKGQAAVSASCSSAELSVTQGRNVSCLPRCQAHLLYREADKRFSETWIFAWALLCFLSSGLTVITFMMNRDRFHYPERPIAYLAMCYFFASSGYLLRAGLGYRKAACHAVSGTPVAGEYLIQAGFEDVWCTMVFLLLNYFGLASSVWWLILGVAWWLSASRKWSHEGVDSVSSLFHMFAWALPAIQSIMALILHRIDADELSGLCSVGNRDRNSLLYFVIMPNAVCLVVGLVFALFGFAAVFRVRRDLKSPAIRAFAGDVANRRRLEKLIAKLGVFAILYTVPATGLIASHLYDFFKLPDWLSALRETKTTCFSEEEEGVAWLRPGCQPRESPSPEVGMLRIFTSLVMGISSGMWVWANRKTCVSFRRACTCGSASASGAHGDKFAGDGRPGGFAKESGGMSARGYPLLSSAASGGGGSLTGVSPKTQLSEAYGAGFVSAKYSSCV